MTRVNFLLHNHGPVGRAGPAFEPLIDYFWPTLAAHGFDVTVSDEKFYGDAINVYFEYFLDVRLLYKLFAIKKNYNVKVGVIATELIVADDIPYMREGIVHVDPGEGRQVTGDESVQASRLRVKNLLDHAGSFDFVWSLLERTHALMRKFNPNSHLFPIGYRAPLRPVPTVAKDIDVFFFGTMTPYRAALIEEIRAAKLNVVCVGRNTEIGYVPSFIIDSMIDRSKVVLNLTLSDRTEDGGVDPKFVSCFRVASALSRGALVVSEAIIEDNPYAPYMLNFPRADLTRRCAEIVANQEAATVAHANFERFREKMDAVKIAAPALEALRGL